MGKKDFIHKLRILLKEVRETRRQLKLIQRIPLNVRNWIFVFSFDVRRSSFKTIHYGINVTCELLQNNLMLMANR